MKNYYRLMLGKKSTYAEACHADGFIGADFGIPQSLAPQLGHDRRAFNAALIPVYLTAHPDKTKIAAGLACGALFSICAAMQLGDIVLRPDGAGAGRYLVGEIAGGYSYAPNDILPHRRAIRWLNTAIDRPQMTEALRNSCGSINTLSDITDYAAEIDRLIAGAATAGSNRSSDETTDPTGFAFEKHLEDFLVRNWPQVALAKDFDIFAEDGEQVGQQYPTDTGPMDLLCISKDQKTLLVVELKRGRASDAVVGQVLRYMGYVQAELAEPGQTVKGVIIALEDDPRMQRALAMVPNISFYRYEISFRLMKA